MSHLPPRRRCDQSVGIAHRTHRITLLGRQTTPLCPLAAIGCQLRFRIRSRFGSVMTDLVGPADEGAQCECGYVLSKQTSSQQIFLSYPKDPQALLTAFQRTDGGQLAIIK